MKRIYRKSRASWESLAIAKNCANKATDQLRTAFRKKENIEKAMDSARLALQKSAITVRNRFSNSTSIGKLSAIVESEELILVFTIYQIKQALRNGDQVVSSLTDDEKTKAIKELNRLRSAEYVDLP